MLSATEVMVIDAPQGAAAALGAYRPRHERTHLICRWPDELAPAFVRRVLKRLAKIRRGAEVAALTLVLGGDPAFSCLLPELGLDFGLDLASTIAPMGSLTLVGLGSSQTQVVEWFELLRTLLDPSVALGAWFPPA
jgi:hypothetical protein